LLTALVALPVALPTALVALSAALLIVAVGADFALPLCLDELCLPLDRLDDPGLRFLDEPVGRLDELDLRFEADLVLV
jgi:hypothetical protein